MFRLSEFYNEKNLIYHMIRMESKEMSQTLFIILTITVLGLIPGCATTCTGQWTGVSDRPSICYSSVAPMKMNWSSAMQYCKDLDPNATLPYFNDISEYQSYRYLALNSNMSSTVCNYHWLSNVQDTKWIVNNMSYVFPYYDDTNPSFCGADDSYLQHISTGYGWRKACGNAVDFFLCQRRFGTDPPVRTAKVLTCENGWMADVWGNCYLYINRAAQYSDAVISCSMKDAFLPSFCGLEDYREFVSQQRYFANYSCVQDTWLDKINGVPGTCIYDTYTKFFNETQFGDDCIARKPYFCQIRSNQSISYGYSYEGGSVSYWNEEYGCPLPKTTTTISSSSFHTEYGSVSSSILLTTIDQSSSTSSLTDSSAASSTPYEATSRGRSSTSAGTSTFATSTLSSVSSSAMSTASIDSSKHTTQSQTPSSTLEPKSTSIITSITSTKLTETRTIAVSTGSVNILSTAKESPSKLSFSSTLISSPANSVTQQFPTIVNFEITGSMISSSSSVASTKSFMSSSIVFSSYQGITSLYPSSSTVKTLGLTTETASSKPNVSSAPRITSTLSTIATNSIGTSATSYTVSEFQTNLSLSPVTTASLKLSTSAILDVSEGRTGDTTTGTSTIMTMLSYSDQTPFTISYVYMDSTETSQLRNSPSSGSAKISVGIIAPFISTITTDKINTIIRNSSTAPTSSFPTSKKVPHSSEATTSIQTTRITSNQPVSVTTVTIRIATSTYPSTYSSPDISIAITSTSISTFSFTSPTTEGAIMKDYEISIQTVSSSPIEPFLTATISTTMLLIVTTLPTSIKISSDLSTLLVSSDQTETSEIFTSSYYLSTTNSDFTIQITSSAPMHKASGNISILTTTGFDLMKSTNFLLTSSSTAATALLGSYIESSTAKTSTTTIMTSSQTTLFYSVTTLPSNTVQSVIRTTQLISEFSPLISSTGVALTNATVSTTFSSDSIIENYTSSETNFETTSLYNPSVPFSAIILVTRSFPNQVASTTVVKTIEGTLTYSIESTDSKTSIAPIVLKSSTFDPKAVRTSPITLTTVGIATDTPIIPNDSKSTSPISTAESIRVTHGIADESPSSGMTSKTESLQPSIIQTTEIVSKPIFSSALHINTSLTALESVFSTIPSTVNRLNTNIAPTVVSSSALSTPSSAISTLIVVSTENSLCKVTSDGAGSTSYCLIGGDTPVAIHVNNGTAMSILSEIDKDLQVTTTTASPSASLPTFQNAVTKVTAKSEPDLGNGSTSKLEQSTTTVIPMITILMKTRADLKHIPRQVMEQSSTGQEVSIPSGITYEPPIDLKGAMLAAAIGDNTTGSAAENDMILEAMTVTMNSSNRNSPSSKAQSSQLKKSSPKTANTYPSSDIVSITKGKNFPTSDQQVAETKFTTGNAAEIPTLEHIPVTYDSIIIPSGVITTTASQINPLYATTEASPTKNSQMQVESRIFASTTFKTDSASKSKAAMNLYSINQRTQELFLNLESTSVPLDAKTSTDILHIQTYTKSTRTKLRTTTGLNLASVLYSTDSKSESDVFTFDETSMSVTYSMIKPSSNISLIQTYILNPTRTKFDTTNAPIILNSSRVFYNRGSTSESDIFMNGASIGTTYTTIERVSNASPIQTYILNSTMSKFDITSALITLNFPLAFYQKESKLGSDVLIPTTTFMSTTYSTTKTLSNDFPTSITTVSQLRDKLLQSKSVLRTSVTVSAGQFTQSSMQRQLYSQRPTDKNTFYSFLGTSKLMKKSSTLTLTAQGLKLENKVVPTVLLGSTPTGLHPNSTILEAVVSTSSEKPFRLQSISDNFLLNPAPDPQASRSNDPDSLRISLPDMKSYGRKMKSDPLLYTRFTINESDTLTSIPLFLTPPYQFQSTYSKNSTFVFTSNNANFASALIAVNHQQTPKSDLLNLQYNESASLVSTVPGIKFYDRRVNSDLVTYAESSTTAFGAATSKPMFLATSEITLPIFYDNTTIHTSRRGFTTSSLFTKKGSAASRSMTTELFFPVQSIVRSNGTTPQEDFPMVPLQTKALGTTLANQPALDDDLGIGEMEFASASRFIQTTSELVVTELILQPEIHYATPRSEKRALDDPEMFGKLSALEKLAIVGVNQEAIKDPIALSSSIQDSLPFVLQDLNDNLWSSIGEQKYSLISDCLFDGVPCDDRKITVIRNSMYGNCFSFNNENESTVEYSTSAGIENGLKLVLHVDQSDYSCTVEQAGIRMLIHDQEVQPTPETEGYYIQTGIATYFNIIQSKQNMIVPRCFDLHDTTFDYAYSVESCQTACYQSYVMKNCGCTDPRYMIIESRGYRQCGFDEKLCLDYYLMCNDTLEHESCDCRPKCSDTIYTATITKTQMKTNKDHQCRSNSNATVCKKKNDHALIYVFYGSLKVIVFTEVHAYQVIRDQTDFIRKLPHSLVFQFSQLLSDFSGVGGLYVGIGSFTLFECIPFVYWSVQYLTSLVTGKIHGH